MDEHTALFGSTDDHSGPQPSESKKSHKNWPSFCPRKLRFLYHNIHKQIGNPVLKPFVYREYIFWYVSVATLTMNFIAAASRLGAQDVLSNAVRDFVVSLILFFILIPCYFLVYFTLYRSVRAKGMTHLLFYILALVRSICNIVFMIAIPGAGSAGLGTMIQAFKQGKATIGFLNLVSFLLWGTIAVFHTLSLIFIYRASQKLKHGGLEKHEASNELTYITTDEPKEEKHSLKEEKKKEKTRTPMDTEQGSFDDFYN